MSVPNYVHVIFKTSLFWRPTGVLLVRIMSKNVLPRRERADHQAEFMEKLSAEKAEYRVMLSRVSQESAC